MPRVLFLTPSDPAADFGESVLFRAGVERTLHRSASAALADALARPPGLIVAGDGADPKLPDFMRQLKRHAETRRVSIVVVAPVDVDPQPLRKAGASLVLHPPIDPLQWDDRLEELMQEPRRKDTRIPARFVVWPRPVTGPTDCVALNLSVRGMLLEAQQPLPLGTTLELRFELPGGSEQSEVVGQVVRQASSDDGRLLYGVDFIILRGDSHELIQGFVDAEGS